MAKPLPAKSIAPVPMLRLNPGEMAGWFHAMDWSQTPLGPVTDWPQSLRVAVGICLNSRFPMLGHVQVSLRRVASTVEISVSDNGEGIDAAFLPFVFDRFRQADASTTRRHGGLGLGLSIVKKLAELHGGSIRVSSDGPGLGATFVLALPLAAIRPAHGEQGRNRPDQTAAAGGDVEGTPEIAGLRVMVVDDDPDARNLVKQCLEDCRAVVVTAGSAEDAIKLMRQTRFDVLVSDIGMPEEDGYTLLRRVRALGAPTPVRKTGSRPSAPASRCIWPSRLKRRN